jgi:hypothetical protein
MCFKALTARLAIRSCWGNDRGFPADIETSSLTVSSPKGELGNARATKKIRIDKKIAKDPSFHTAYLPVLVL